jgi:hypothetical protein
VVYQEVQGDVNLTYVMLPLFDKVPILYIISEQAVNKVGDVYHQQQCFQYDILNGCSCSPVVLLSMEYSSQMIIRLPTNAPLVKCREPEPHLRGPPASGPVPVTTFNTPAGRPTSCAIAASSRHVRLAISLGFSTQQLPAARAGATFHYKTSAACHHHKQCRHVVINTAISSHNTC